VKKFWKSVSNWPRYWQNFVAYFFWATLYVLLTVQPRLYFCWSFWQGRKDEGREGRETDGSGWDDRL